MTLFRMDSHSSNLRGRLSKALGRRKPCSMRVDFRDRSPLYIPLIWGMEAWLSSTIMRKSSGK